MSVVCHKFVVTMVTITTTTTTTKTMAISGK
jgi:hypothetical protein